MKATIFTNIYGLVTMGGRENGEFLTEEADTAEECLRKMADHLQPKLGYQPTLTFRPDDGMIYWWEKSTMPVGVLYRQGYR